MWRSQRFHEIAQEVITWSGTVMTVTALYYLFIAPPKFDANAPLQLRVRDAQTITEADNATMWKRVLSFTQPQPEPSATSATATSERRLR